MLRPLPSLLMMLCIVVVSGCANKPAHLTGDAREIADRFMVALVVDRNSLRAQQYAHDSLGDLTSLLAGFKKEGLFRSVGNGRILSGCNPGVNLVGLPESDDCIEYRLKARARSGDFIVSKRIEFRVWLDRAGSRWLITAYQEFVREFHLE